MRSSRSKMTREIKHFCKQYKVFLLQSSPNNLSMEKIIIFLTKSNSHYTLYAGTAEFQVCDLFGIYCMKSHTFLTLVKTDQKTGLWQRSLSPTQRLTLKKPRSISFI